MINLIKQFSIKYNILKIIQLKQKDNKKKQMKNTTNLLLTSKNLTDKNKSQYQLYEDELNNYKNRNKSKLQQWNMISSRIVGQQMMGKKGYEGYKNQGIQAKSARQMYESQVKSGKMSRISEDKSKNQASLSYVDKIEKQFETVDYPNKTIDDLNKQLKTMRQMLIQLNTQVTNKLNKYQIATYLTKTNTNQYQTYKQQQLLKAKIINNQKILQSLQKQKKEIQQKDKQLEQKDYLIQLQESTNIILRDIKQKRKLKHHQGVTVQKLDGKLVQMKQLQLDSQFKIVKILKHNILYYFKKFQINNGIIQELDRNYSELVEKDQKITKRYNQFAKYAEQANMLVKANKNYVGNKKLQDQLTVKIQQIKKKIEVIKRSKQIQCEKLQKQIDIIKRQCASHQNKTQEISSFVNQFVKNTNQTIQKHQISNKLLNRISYKFAQALLKDTTRNTAQSILDSAIQQQHQKKVKVTSKPNLNKKNNLNSSVQINSRYQTINIYDSQNKQQKINDKNVETIDFQNNRSKQFRIKPTLNVKKRNQINKSTLQYSSMQVGEQSKEEIQSNFKPKRFQKILSQRKQKQIF